MELRKEKTMIRKREPKPKEKVIPVTWIEAYAKDNGSEIQDILEYMLEVWDAEDKKNKQKK